MPGRRLAAWILLALDLASGTRVRTIRQLAEPQGVLFVKGVNLLFVANRRDGSLRLFDGTSLELRKTAPLGEDAVHRQLDPDRYEEAARLETVKGARTSFFSAELRRLFLAARREAAAPAAIWVYEAAK